MNRRMPLADEGNIDDSATIEFGQGATDTDICFELQVQSVRRRTASLDKVPPLPYHYDDLEPYIDTRTMKLHYEG